MNTAIQLKLHRLLILVIILMVVPAMTAVADPSGHGEEEGAQRVLLLKNTVTIEKKKLEEVTTTIGETYALSRQTIIVGLDGHQVSIRKMPVPCDAEISYVVDQGVYRAQRITITSVSDNSTWQWTSDIPE